MRKTNANKQIVKEIILETQGIYEDLGKLRVTRNCVGRAECCHFKLTGRTPYLTAGEAITAAKAWKSTGRKLLPEKEDGSCPFLDQTQKCLIYDDRPFGCRTHFCAAAGGVYARKDVLDLIRRLEVIDRRLGGEGSLPLTTALQKTGLLSS